MYLCRSLNIFYMENKIESVDLLLKSAWQAVSKMYSEQAAAYNSTIVQALTLLKVDPKRGTRSTQLGPKMAIEPTSLTRIIKLLEDQNYIYKEKTTTDKREVIIRLTDRGLNFRNISREIVLDFNRKIMETISQEKFEIFKEVVTEIQKIATEQQVNKK